MGESANFNTCEASNMLQAPVCKCRPLCLPFVSIPFLFPETFQQTLCHCIWCRRADQASAQNCITLEGCCGLLPGTEIISRSSHTNSCWIPEPPVHVHAKRVAYTSNLELTAKELTTCLSCIRWSSGSLDTRKDEVT